jgi:hypothetical protein
MCCQIGDPENTQTAFEKRFSRPFTLSGFRAWKRAAIPGRAVALKIRR